MLLAYFKIFVLDCCFTSNQPKQLEGYIKILILLFFPVILISCNTTQPPPPEKPKVIKLELITKSCTEEFIKVIAKNSILPVPVTIKRNGKEIMKFYLTKRDTTVIDTGLLPAKTYTYLPVAEIDEKEEEGESLPVTTLDTTSNSFTWQTYTFGEHSSSVLNDVAIIDENDIWAVGEIHTKDTDKWNADSTEWVQAYNAIHWNGSKWELKRIYFPTVCGSTNLSTFPAKAIFAFDDGQIWISSSGDKIAVLKDNNQVNKFCLPSTVAMSINKIWGTSSEDMYFVGLSGSIAHYNGSSWQKIESGTNYMVQDIYGYVNLFTGKTEILCTASARDNKDSEIIKINKNLTAEKLNKVGLEYAIQIWFKSGIMYYVTGNGLFEKKYNNTSNWVNLNKDRTLTSNFMNGIGGNELNNIIVTGAYGEVLHYNGIRWKSLKNNETSLVNGWYGSVSVKGNKIVAVGLDGRKAVILIGNHNN